MSISCMNVDEQAGVCVIGFAEGTSLDTPNTEAVRPELYAAVEGAQGSHVVLDLENIAFVCSHALGCLLTVRLKAVRANSRLVLAGVPEHLKAILSITQLDQMFEMFPTRAEALKELAAG